MNNVIHMFSDMEDMKEVEVPFGSLEEEVADDVPVLLSEGEYVVPADVVRYWGLKHLEEMRTMAKCGLMSMEMDGRLHKVDDDVEEVEIEEDIEEEEEGNEDEETMLMMQEMYSMEEPEMMEFDIDDMQEDMSEEEEEIEEVDFDGKKKIADDDDDEFDEDDLVFTVRAIGMENGGNVSGDMGEVSGPNEGIGGGVSGEDDETGLGVATTAELQEITEGIAEMHEANVAASKAGVSPWGQQALEYSGATKSPGMMNEMSKMSVEEKEKEIEDIVDARVAVNPTSRQMDLNAMTETGFQQANPGITDFVDVAATVLGRINPAIGAVMSVGNTINAMTGRDTVGINVPSVAAGIMGMTGLDDVVSEKMSGFTDSLSEFVESVPGKLDDTYGREENTGQQIEEQMKKLSETDMADLQKIINQTIDIKGVGKIPIRNSLASSVINAQRNDDKADTTGYPIPLS
tara:strand:- start:1818 stop:3194 length:1377 start_codon:yes stop_codon:yes gene_type:complete